MKKNNHLKYLFLFLVLVSALLLSSKELPDKSGLIREKVDEKLAEFQKIPGQPVWDEWVAGNKDQFDAQGVLDAIFTYAKEAQNQ